MAARVQGLTIRVLRPLVSTLRAMGCDADALLVQAGIDPARVLDAAQRVPEAAAATLWRLAVEATGDPHLGLHVAESLDVRVFQHVEFETEYLVVQLVAISATVDEALARFARYFPLSYGSSSRLVVERRAEAVQVRLAHPPSFDPPAAMNEHTLGWTARAIRDFAQTPVPLTEVRFAHSAQGSASEHERVFGAPVRFGANEDGFSFPVVALATPLRAPRPLLAEALVRRADEQMAALRAHPSTADRVRLALAEELAGTGAEAIAERLGISVRTLARRLHAEGTSVQALIDEVRSTLAHRYLVVDRMPVTEVADRLGFSEPSTFHRAFKRWYGCAPSRYRGSART